MTQSISTFGLRDGSYAVAPAFTDVSDGPGNELTPPRTQLCNVSSLLTSEEKTVLTPMTLQDAVPSY